MLIDDPSPFSVFAADQSLDGDRLLEASAGTGKTYSIAHLVVRLLVEEESLSLRDILVVTFTRAATRELRQRIALAIEETLDALKQGEELPEYLTPEKRNGAMRRLAIALLQVEEAEIYTIHGFCARQLLGEGEEFLSGVQMRTITQDVCTKVAHTDILSPFQLQILLKHHGYHEERLLEAVESLAVHATAIFPYPTWRENCAQLQKAFESLPSCDSSLFLEDLIAQAGQYKGLCDRAGSLKGVYLDAAQYLSSLFDKKQVSERQLEASLVAIAPLLKLLQPENRKKRQMKDVSLHSPGQLEEVVLTLLPLVEATVCPELLLLCLAAEVQKALVQMKREEGWMTPDDLLASMWKLCQQPAEVERIRGQYRVAMIDEFQDTDHLQWQIFDHLFRQGEKQRLILVGDPKQSIYRFRGADLYSFLEAREGIDPDHVQSLAVNYRAQPDLVEALNELFGRGEVAWLQLPKTGTALSCPSVLAGREEEEGYSDQRAPVISVPFTQSGRRNERVPSLEAEREMVLFVVEQLRPLIAKAELSWNDVAILVRDRFQLRRIELFLEEQGIPSTAQRVRLITEGEASTLLYSLLQATCAPDDLHVVREFCCRLYGSEQGPFTDARCAQEAIQLNQLQECLTAKGPYAWWLKLRKCLSLPPQLIEDLQQLAELFADFAQHRAWTAEALLLFWNHLEELKRGDDESLNRRQRKGKGIQLLTIHVSKGLEFPVVFPIGVTSRTPKPSTLQVVEEEEGAFLRLLKEDDPCYGEIVAESNAEKLRLFYVALTRASRRLYIPELKEELKTAEYGKEAVIEIFKKIKK